MKNVLKWILAVPMFIIMPATYIGGIAIYIWTIIVAFNVYGFIGAAISLFTPILSTIYIAYKAWSLFGFDSAYLQWVIVYVIFVIIGMILLGVVNALDDDK